MIKKRIKPAGAQIKPVSMAKVFSGAGRAIGKNFGALFLLTSFVCLISILEQRISDSTGRLAVLLIYLLLNFFITASLDYFSYLCYNGISIKPGKLFTAALKRLWKYLVANALSGILSMLGFLLLIIPGVYAGNVLAFSGLAALVEDKEIKPLHFSREVVKGYFWKVFVFNLVFLSLPLLVAALMIAASKQGFTAVIRPGFLALFEVLMVPWMIFFYPARAGLYTELRKLKAGALKKKPLVTTLKNSNEAAGCLLAVVLWLAMVVSFTFLGVALVMKYYPHHVENLIPGETVGCGRYHIRDFARFMKIPDICDMEYFGSKGKKPLIVLAGYEKAYVLDEKGRISSAVDFQIKFQQKVRALDIDSDGLPEYFKGTTYHGAIIALRSEGVKMLDIALGKKVHAEAVAGDMDNDGRMEIAVECPDTKELMLYDLTGARLWKKKIKGLKEIGMCGPEGKKEITFFDEGRKLNFMDKEGNITLSYKPKYYINSLDWISWIGSKGKDCIFSKTGDKAAIYDRAGAKIIDLKLPKRAGPGTLTAVFEGRSKQGYFACVIKPYMSSNQVLCVYDAMGANIFTEVLSNRVDAIMAYHNGFMLAGDGRIIRYEDNGAAAADKFAAEE